MRPVLSSLKRVPITVLTCAALAACGTVQHALRPFALSRARTASIPETSRRFVAWAAEEPYLIVVTKPDHLLEVYEHGERTRAYPAVFGRVAGRKVFEGDKRTPAGLYRITRKRPHRRFHRFLDLDYPSSEDVRKFREARRDGLVPVSLHDGRSPGPGGLVGIHGTNDENLNRLMVDWTLGCVSLTNEDVEELYALVPEGTLVLIRDDESPFVLTQQPPTIQLTPTSPPGTVPPPTREASAAPSSVPPATARAGASATGAGSSEPPPPAASMPSEPSRSAASPEESSRSAASPEEPSLSPPPESEASRAELDGRAERDGRPETTRPRSASVRPEPKRARAGLFGLLVPR